MASGMCYMSVQIIQCYIFERDEKNIWNDNLDFVYFIVGHIQDKHKSQCQVSDCCLMFSE